MLQMNPLPDLVVLEIALPGMDGFEVCRRLKQSPVTCDIPVVFVTVVRDASQEAHALELQAADYFSKPYSVSVARARIRRACSSGIGTAAVLHNGHTAGTSPNAEDRPSGASMCLGKREMEVLILISDGMTSAEIAEQLFIAKGTVEVHRENIMRKLGVRNIASLVKCAIRNGLLHP